MTHDGNQQIETYVRRLTGALQPLPQQDRAAVASEIQSHLSDCAARGDEALERALDRMGLPELLARSYVEEYRLAGAVERGSPARLLLVILSVATRSLLSFVGGLAAIALYLIALAMVVVAGAKLAVPAKTGMWTGPDFFGFGIMDPPPTAQELLGYWIMPLCALLATACFLGANKLLRLVGRRILKRADRRLAVVG